ncbi:hypothetical protein GS538_09165 [Rhodococcus hoagii]|nr:hypothetical protein [Prescottella equi]
MHDIFALLRAADAVAELFDDSEFRDDTARRANCGEADVIAQFLEGCGKEDACEAFMAAHRATDDPDDNHTATIDPHAPIALIPVG